jgi:TrbL/VirB6 plasmid conjugal transfer protein
MGKTFNARYWSWVVILGAMWLAWWGLVRRRASKVTEGAIWMVAAMVGLIWLIARPADFTTLGTKVSAATSTAFNAALPQSDTKGATCIPSPNGGNPLADPNMDPTTRNANGLWVALVCKPWLMGEFGTNNPDAKIVKDNADKLLNAQAIDLAETYSQQTVDLNKKSDNYKAVANDIKTNYPGTYGVFQGKQWNSRLAVAFGGLFAALVAGMLILVISITLIVVKIAFLLLLVAGPIFLGIGIHPGIGRVIAIRWLELLLSMLLKQAALIGVLALLLWAYGLILGEGLPWGLQILLIALVTFAAFIYRKPFQHLFSAVGYSAVGSREKSEEHLTKSITEARKSTTTIATGPGAAGYRIARWAKRDTMQGSEAAGGTDTAGTAGGVTSDPTGVVLGRNRAATVIGGASGAVGGSRSRGGAPPLNLPAKNGGGSTAASRPGGGLAGTVRASGGGSSGSGAGASRPTSWASGGRGGAAAGSGGSGSGGGGGWFSGGSSGGGAGAGSGGRSGGGASGDGGAAAGGRARGRGWFSGGGDSGSRGSGGGAPPSGGRGTPTAPSRGLPKPRSGGGSNPAASGAGDRAQEAPPLWAKPAHDDGPPIPFWLRPVERDDG